jgi:hypothetical protein
MWRDYIAVANVVLVAEPIDERTVLRTERGVCERVEHGKRT